MVTVMLYADRMMPNQPTSADQVYYATRDHSRLYDDAAQKLGLSSKQYAEFRQDLLTGKVSYVRIPERIDAMAGQHSGQVYVLRNVQVVQHSMGWQVIALNDGTRVYVLAGLRKPLDGQSAGRRSDTPASRWFANRRKSRWPRISRRPRRSTSDHRQLRSPPASGSADAERRFRSGRRRGPRSRGAHRLQWAALPRGSADLGLLFHGGGGEHHHGSSVLGRVESAPAKSNCQTGQ